MKVLIAEDDAVSRRLLVATLDKLGYEVVIAADGAEAWTALQSADAPHLAILDWMMPEIDGVELCRRVRDRSTANPPYLILLTAKSGKEDVVTGFDAGANDYLTKPFDRAELRARVQAGVNVLELQANLSARVRELEATLSQIKQLQGLLPICSYCKKIRDERDYWHRVESYISEHAAVEFSHGICPACYLEVVQPQLDQIGTVGNHTTGKG
jgi:sigma-B regulation protein RsbU (phosphoserine phosphatase)